MSAAEVMAALFLALGAFWLVALVRELDGKAKGRG